MDNDDDGGDGDGRPCPQCGGNDRVIKMLTSGPHLAAGAQPPRSFDFDLDVDDVDNGREGTNYSGDKSIQECLQCLTTLLVLPGTRYYQENLLKKLDKIFK